MKFVLRHLRRKTLPALLYLPLNFRDLVFCICNRLPWHSSWRFWGLPIISVSRKGKAKIGKHLVLCSNPRRNSIGVMQPVVIRVGSNAILQIGDDVGISGSSISVSKTVTIGNYVMIGSGCLILDNDAHPLDPEGRTMGERPKAAPVIIHDHAFIGARSIILKGVSIGEGSVVGAGSVVTRDVPAYAICAGNPARIVGNVRKNLAGEHDLT